MRVSVVSVFGMQGTKFSGANKQQLTSLFTYLENCLEQIVKDNELGALRQALKVFPAPVEKLSPDSIHLVVMPLTGSFHGELRLL